MINLLSTGVSGIIRGYIRRDFSWGFRDIPECLGGFSCFPGIFKGFQRVSEGFRKVPRVFRNVYGDFKGFWGAPGLFRENVRGFRRTPYYSRGFLGTLQRFSGDFEGDPEVFQGISWPFQRV